MKMLWAFAKVLLVLALAIPVSFIVLTTALGIFGVLVGLVAIAVRLAIVGGIAYVAYRVIKALVGGPSTPARPREIAMPRVDPYYEAAVKEVDRDIGWVK
jgi:hypothetical protein